MIIQLRTFKIFALFALIAPFFAHSANRQPLEDYTSISEALVVDNLEKSLGTASRFQQTLSDWLGKNPTSPQIANIRIIHLGIETFLLTKTLEEARKAFIQISHGTIAFIRADKDSLKKWQLFFCPMVDNGEGYWVQPTGGKISNPYMGSSMPNCGSKRPW